MNDQQPPEVAKDSGPEIPADAERQIEKLVDEFVDDLCAGKCPDRRAMAVAHPEIADALERRLELVETMYRLGRDADVARSPALERRGPDGVSDEHPPLTSSHSGFNAEQAIHIKCPHCGNRVQLVDPDPQVVTCLNCGSSFQVMSGATLTHRQAALPERIGKFEVLELLGRGAFGAVYKARDPELDRTVAIKVPRAGYFETDEEEERFLREARSAARLKHSNIVQVHEIGHERGVPYIVSDYVEGLTLADRLTGGNRLSFRESAELIAQLADALAFAHGQKVIHRDIKPSNVLLDDAGRPHLTDFGLARRDEGEITVTLDGQILGTPAYMSPEQAAGDQKKVDARSDVFSLGVLLYELLTRELPFRGNNRMLLHQVLHDDPRPPRTLNDAIPRDLETICLRAMAKEPSRRYSTAHELQSELGRYLNGEPIHARPVGKAERFWRWCRRNPAAAALVGVSGVAAVLLVGLAVASSYNERLNGALHEAEKQRTRAENSLELAEEARRAEKNLREDKEHLLEQKGELLTETTRAKGAEEEARIRADRNLYLYRIALADRELAEDPWAAKDTLTQCPPNLRHWEWHYLSRRSGKAEAVTKLQAHDRAVYQVVFSPDGNRLVSAGWDGKVKMWDLGRNEVVATYAVKNEKCFGVSFSPNGKLLAAAGGDLLQDEHSGRIVVWDLSSNSEVTTLSGHTNSVYSVAFSPDGLQLVSAGGDNSIRVWDLSEGRELQRFVTEPSNPGAHAVLSPDGKILAAGIRHGSLSAWDTSTWQQLFRVGPSDEHRQSVQSSYRIAFDPAGKYIVSASGPNWRDGIQIRDAQTGEVVHNLGISVRDPRTKSLSHTTQLFELAFSPDGRRLATASGDGTVKVWDMATFQVLLTLYLQDKVFSVAFSPDGRRLAAGYGASGEDSQGFITIWDAGVPENEFAVPDAAAESKSQ